MAGFTGLFEAENHICSGTFHLHFLQNIGKTKQYYQYIIQQTHLRNIQASLLLLAGWLVRLRCNNSLMMALWCRNM
jgi:hypothetical protein